jgi:hypothetical protein
LEVINIAQRCGIPLEGVVELLERQKYLLQMRAVSDAERNKALQIMAQGHAKSGCPSIRDALFHAKALCNEGVLVTADKRILLKQNTLAIFVC